MVDYLQIASDMWVDYGPFIVLAVAAIVIFVARLIRKKRIEKKAKAAMGYNGKAAQQMTPPPRAPMSEGGQQQVQQMVQEHSQRENGTPAPQPPKSPPPPQPKPRMNNDDFARFFNEDQRYDDITSELASWSYKMEQATEEMENNVNEEVQNLNLRLLEVTQRKEQIREYGKKLASLFMRYEEREQQIATTLVQLDKLMARKKRMQPNPPQEKAPSMGR